MGNEVTETKAGSVFGNSGVKLDTTKLAQAMAESAQKDPRGGGPEGSVFMNFSGKLGKYEIGIEKTDADPKEVWLVNVAGFQDGWICWKGGRPVAVRLYNMGQPVPEPDKAEHSPFGDGEGWYQAKAMTLRSIDSGVQAYWKINSVSGVSVMASLQKDVTQRIVAGMAYWPVVTLSKETFIAQNKKNFKPIITVEGWLDDTRVAELGAMFDDPEAEVDLADMFAKSATSGGAISDKSGNGEVAKRNRRASV
jgi:hypothetical protein